MNNIAKLKPKSFHHAEAVKTSRRRSGGRGEFWLNAMRRSRVRVGVSC
jgi:hypothetical protein